MGTTCNLKWREIAEKERLWTVCHGHPIVEGIPEYFEIPHAEMYGERFDIPAPDELIFISWFAGGEVFRSGCCFHRGCGKIFYFRPGHETYPIFYQPEVRQVIANAVRWAAPFPLLRLEEALVGQHLQELAEVVPRSADLLGDVSGARVGALRELGEGGEREDRMDARLRDHGWGTH